MKLRVIYITITSLASLSLVSGIMAGLKYNTLKHIAKSDVITDSKLERISVADKDTLPVNVVNNYYTAAQIALAVLQSNCVSTRDIYEECAPLNVNLYNDSIWIIHNHPICHIEISKKDGRILSIYEEKK